MTDDILDDDLRGIVQSCPENSILGSGRRLCISGPYLVGKIADGGIRVRIWWLYFISFAG